jgi:hypothetical protein
MARVPAVWRYAGNAARADGWWACMGHEVFRDPAGLTMACGGPAAGHHFFFSVLAAAGRSEAWSLDIRIKEESQ